MSTYVLGVIWSWCGLLVSELIGSFSRFAGTCSKWRGALDDNVHNMKNDCTEDDPKTSFVHWYIHKTGLQITDMELQLVSFWQIIILIQIKMTFPCQAFRSFCVIDPITCWMCWLRSWGTFRWMWFRCLFRGSAGLLSWMSTAMLAHLCQLPVPDRVYTATMDCLVQSPVLPLCKALASHRELRLRVLEGQHLSEAVVLSKPPWDSLIVPEMSHSGPED